MKGYSTSLRDLSQMILDLEFLHVDTYMRVFSLSSYLHQGVGAPKVDQFLLCQSQLINPSPAPQVLSNRRQLQIDMPQIAS